MPPSRDGAGEGQSRGGRDISDEVVVKRGHCWKCTRVTYQGVAIGEFMFECPTPEDFVAPYTMERIEEWRSA